MVRPAHRRPGQSRKAQYGLFAAYVIAVTGAVAGLLLAILSVVDPIGFAQLRVASQEITAPIARVTRSVTGSLSGIDDSVGAYRSEEHTSELQSLMRISYAVFCLKKKKAT